jgi:hypothetical protein
VLEFNIAPSEVREMTAGEIKTLIRYKNGESPEAPTAHYEELLQDLRKAKNERSRNSSSQDNG